MSRVSNPTVTAAVALNHTSPKYLIQMGWSTVTRIATWETSISWAGETWAASGANIRGLKTTGGTLVLPNDDDDGWAALVLSEGQQGRTISIYEHHTDISVSPQTDALLIFSGEMDQATIGREVMITFIASSREMRFPHTKIDSTVYTHLLRPGQVLEVGGSTLVIK